MCVWDWVDGNGNKGAVGGRWRMRFGQWDGEGSPRSGVVSGSQLESMGNERRRKHVPTRGQGKVSGG